MSLALAAFRRLGRSMMPGTPQAAPDYVPHRRRSAGDLGPDDDVVCKLTKFHVVCMIAGMTSLIMVIVGYALHEWYGVLYVVVAFTGLVLLPLIVFKIVMNSRQNKNRYLRNKKNYHKSAEQLHKEHPHLYASSENAATAESNFLKVPSQGSLFNIKTEAGGEDLSSLPENGQVTFYGETPTKAQTSSSYSTSV